MTATITVSASTSARRMLASPGALFFGVVFAPLVVSVISALWRAAADASGGTIAGYSARSVTWYLVTSEASILCIPTRLIEETGDAIGSGAVTAELLRPQPPVIIRMALEAGASFVKLCSMLPVLLVLAVVTVGAPPSVGALALAVPSLVLAALCNIAGQHVVSAVAFWLRDATSAWFLYQKAVFLLGGMLIPLEALPHGLGVAARCLPFAAMAYAPARIASGHIEPYLLVTQAAWLLALVVGARVAFAAGERRLTGAAS